MKYRRNTEDLHEQALRQHAESVALQNEADIAYLAMIQGVDLASGEEHVEGGVENV